MRRVAWLLALFGCVFAAVLLPGLAYADESASSANAQVYYLGSTVNAGLDTGFTKSDALTKDDPHFGWSLGSFFVSGYTSVERNGDNPTFLKTTGDTVALYFRLDQDINRLNGNDSLSIAEDTNGYDEGFGIPKTNFGHGTLIVRQTNYENAKGDPQVYTNYLEASASQGADTKVQLFEEGDYEVTLDYEIMDNPRKVPLVNWPVLPSYTNYRICFSFSVRNGNTMVFPFDVATGAELTNSSSTENGFYIDLAKSRYLTVNVKREVLTDSGEGLVEDVRSNVPAEDGKQYTEEGIYTITATNPSTGQTTEKKIYVGTNGVLKAYVATGYSLDEIKSQLSQGATIDAQGNIVWPETSQASEITSGSETSGNGSSRPWLVPIVVVAAAALVVLIVLKRRRRSATPPALGEGETASDGDAANSQEDGSEQGGAE